jgi:hypothetical protein
VNETTRVQYLRIALLAFGILMIVGIYPLSIVWPSGWKWHSHGRSDYFEMILGLYATLGVFLVIAARNPWQHRSLIWFTVWSSFVHGAIMGVQSFTSDNAIGHLPGDVLALFVIGGVLAALLPRKS